MSEEEYKRLRKELYEYCLDMYCPACAYRKTKFCREGDTTLTKLKNWKEQSAELLKEGQQKRKEKPKEEKFPGTSLKYDAYHYKREHNICVKCGVRPPKDGRVTCDECNNKIRKYYAERKKRKNGGKKANGRNKNNRSGRTGSSV